MFIHNAAWYPKPALAHADVQPDLTAWLAYTGSMTQRIEAYTHGSLRVHLRKRVWDTGYGYERDVLKIRDREKCWVREVDLSIHSAAWMYARSVIPKNMLYGHLHVLKQLQDKPIGHQLFSHPQLRRSDFAFAYLKPHHELYHRAIQNIAQPPRALWARYSRLCLGEQAFLLTEVYLNMPWVLRSLKQCSD